MASSNGIAVAFRVDGSANIGMGHVVRCLSLASQVRSKVTSRIYFMMRNYAAAVDKVVEEGYTVLTLPRDLERLDEIRQMDEMVERKSVSVLVMDTPDADRNLVAPFREKKLKVAVIDDLGGRAFGADLLINGSAVERFTTYPPRAADKMLIGPRYMIVKEDFHLQSLRTDCRLVAGYRAYSAGVFPETDAAHPLGLLHGRVPCNPASGTHSQPGRAFGLVSR